MSDKKNLQEAIKLAKTMDNIFRIPGTSFRFGWDTILGLFPGAGDTIATLISLYIIWKVYKAGANTPIILNMLGNVILDLLVGSIPVLGDIFDMSYKANIRNVMLLERHLDEQKKQSET